MKNQPNQLEIPMALAALVATAIYLLAARQASAANDTWSGGGSPDGNWSNAANWDNAPAANDFLNFDTSNQTASTNTFANGTVFGYLGFNSGAGAFTLSPVSGGDGSGIVLTNLSETAGPNLFGGSISNYSSSAQTVNLPVTYSAGNHMIATASGAGQLNFAGTLTRNANATMQYVIGGGAVNYTGSGLSAVNGIIGGWAVVGLGSAAGDWATLSSGNIAAYSSYTTKSGGTSMALSSSGGNAANNFKINTRSSTASTLNSTTSGTYDINTLMWSVSSPSGDQTLNISSGQILRLGTSGAIMNVNAGTRTFNVGNGSSGTITAGGAANTAGEISLYAVPMNNGSQRLQINAAVNDNGSGAVKVNVLGDMVFKVSGTFSGGLYINQGRAQANTTGAFGSGPVYVYPGGSAFPWNSGNSGTFANNFFIAGYGSSQDSLAIRGQNGVTLSGTINLMGTAVVGPNGNLTTSGTISGSGGLYVVGGFGDGSLHLDESSANTYTGNTTIDAVGIGNSGSHNITIWIDNSSHNNIMPSGGGAGNLVLNGGGSTLAQFDIGGSTQTLNGLASTGTTTETLLTSNPGGGTLNVGANNATSEFDGVIGTTGGQGTANINLTKIGTGTLTLGGACNYTGTTTISNGVLALTSSGSISSSTNISVNSTGTFDVSQISFSLASGQALSGNGVVTGAVSTASGSIITPGSSVLTFTNGLTFNPGLNANFQLSASPAVGAVGKIAVGGSALALNGGIVNVTYSTLQAGRYKLMTYSAGESGSVANLILNCPPFANLTGALDDSIPGEIDLVVTAGLISLVWQGDGTANDWDVNTTSNWLFGANGYVFTNGDAVMFNDAGSKSPAINLSGTLSPVSLLVSNNTGTYTFSGGSIAGGATLVKKGSGTLVLTESGDTFVGGIAVSNGTVLIDNDSSGIAGGANVSSGATLQLGNNDGAGVLPSGTMTANGTLVLNHPDDITIGNTIGGAGAINKTNSDTVTLTGINSFSGNINVQSGTLRGWTQNSLGTTNGTITISNGATLDHGWDTTKAIVVSGAGVGGAGAIVNNSSGNAIYDGSGGMTASLTLTGNTTFGGSTRWDLGSPATLNTGGSNYNLTISEADGLYMEWDNVTIDANLGNIDIYTAGGGSLGIKGCGASLGNPTNTITVHTNSGLSFFGENANNSGYAKKIHVLTGGTVNYIPNTSSASNAFFNTTLTLEDNTTCSLYSGSGSIGTVLLQPIQLNGLVHLQVGDSTVTFSNVISGTGGFYWDNWNHTLVFTATNTYTGVTDIRFPRTLSLVGNGSISGSTNISLDVAGAILDATGRGDGTLTLASGQTLAGLGTVRGNLVVGFGATVTPGTNGVTGIFTVTNGNITLSGTTAMKLNQASATNDVLRATTAAASITYGGALSVTNLNGTLVLNDSFKLFSAASYAGDFSATNLPSLDTGLAWNWNPANGTLSVVQSVNLNPTNITTSVSGNVLTLSWPTDHTGWLLQAQTNSLSTGLGTNWVNVAGSASVNSLTVTNDPANGSVFYRMIYP